jgi:hypothetical protein
MMTVIMAFHLPASVKLIAPRAPDHPGGNADDQHG